MMNYVWLGLILLGLAAGLSKDFSESWNNKYRNGIPIPVELAESGRTPPEKDKSKSLEIKISPENIEQIYGQNLEDPIIIDVLISQGSAPGTYTAYWKTPSNCPAVWKEIAQSSGGEDDLTGEFRFVPGNNSRAVSGELFTEKTGYLNLKRITNSALDYAGIAVNIVLGLIGIMAFWLGIMKIAEEGGIINYIARAAKPLTKFLFPDVPQDHPAIAAIVMNLSATFLGLGNAATPFGIKAMEELNKLNPDKDTATNAMCTFLVLNTASFALMPTTAIALRASAGSSDPALIIGTTMFGSFCATIVGLITVKAFEKLSSGFKGFFSYLVSVWKKLFVISLATGLIFLLFSFGLMSGLRSISSVLSAEMLRTIIEWISALAIPLLIALFVGLGAIKKVKIYEAFVEGAKEGFTIAITIIPYLVAILMAIGIFRSGGAMEWLVYVLTPFTDFVGMPAEALPMALMRPLSGSGSLGIMAEIIAVHGPDSYLGILVSTFFGSTETTFYVLAVYFGAVNIRKTRYALPAGLISDVAGILAALYIVKLLFT
ncbi:MAG: spore maturation protein [Ignavibacteriales bacterium]|nr:spore maturation protein [Ignavibacteriales bacterium]MCF8305834.1 spore maturation protein [Ignavibacteriales bacterium]MCF8315556.1 spore maturation protein [Ignavibacteriales bacterium]MCF8436914.1 spore maturation protein [Ignavibacteriales bacterium]